MSRLPMLRTALAAACLVAAGAAPAQELQLHGLLDVSAGRFENAGAPADWRIDNGSMSTSFIGVRGSDDLGGGLKARFAFEHYLQLDSGRAGRLDGDPGGGGEPRRRAHLALSADHRGAHGLWESGGAGRAAGAGSGRRGRPL